MPYVPSNITEIEACYMSSQKMFLLPFFLIFKKMSGPGTAVECQRVQWQIQDFSQEPIIRQNVSQIFMRMMKEIGMREARNSSAHLDLPLKL